MKTKHIVGGVFSIFLASSIVSARSYPIREVKVNNCIAENEICETTLPHIEYAQYDTYKDMPLYRRIYTMLRGSTYKGQRDVGQGSHKGVDIATEPKTPVYATHNGTILAAGRESNRGNVIVIQHEYNGSSVYSIYAHLGTLFVKKGDVVNEQQTIAEVGDTGNASGPHLHFQIDTNQVGVHPFHFYNCPGSITDIVNQGLCRNQLLANTRDPIEFLEKQIKNKQPTVNTTIQFNNFVGGYSRLDTLQFLNIKNTNLDRRLSAITIQFDKKKVRLFPNTIAFLGSQRTIYIRGIQTGFTTIDFIQDNTVIKRIPIIIGEDKTFHVDNDTITSLFENIPLQ